MNVSITSPAPTEFPQLSGNLRPGGRIRGRVASEYLHQDASGAHALYRWRLEFDTVMR